MPSKVPATDERIALELLGNHSKFKRILESLAMNSDLAVLQAHVHSVALGWFSLAREHLAELAGLNLTQHRRAIYSRSYYAAYNASKAVRYVVNGSVSLRGDDHQKVAELPDDFPNVDMWARELSDMYQHRLRADYDNWKETPAENALSPKECALRAQTFIAEAESYLLNRYGLKA